MPLIYEDYDAANFPGIRIYYDPNLDPTFSLTIKEFLNQIVSKPVGLSLLRGLAPNPRPLFAPVFTVRICRAKPPWGEVRAVDLTSGAANPTHNTSNRAIRTNETNAANGTGCTTTVHFNTNMYNTPHGPRPPFIALAHELIHALHNLQGNANVINNDEEENRTVGIGSAANINEPISESRIRAEHPNLPPRSVY